MVFYDKLLKFRATIKNKKAKRRRDYPVWGMWAASRGIKKIQYDQGAFNQQH